MSNCYQQGIKWIFQNMKTTTPEQVFIKIIDRNRKKFLKKLAAYKNMTLHQLWLKGEYNGGWNDDYTLQTPSKMYGALLSYKT